MDSYSFKIWEDPGEICALLKELIDNILLDKFFGPFPEEVTHLNGERMVYLPVFTIEKGDHIPKVPKYRVLLNAAKKHRHTLWTGPENVDELPEKVKRIDFGSDIEFHRFTKEK